MAALIRPSTFARLTSTRAFSTMRSRYNTIPFTLSGTGTGVAQTITVSSSTHVIKTDAYPAFGGADAAPSPLHFNLSALTSCSQVTGSIVAKDHGVKLGKWKVSVTGQLNPAVLVGGENDNGGAGGNWNAVDLKVRVESDAEDGEFQRWAGEVERRCPVTQLFKQSGVQ
jgi:putative redox protein